jgi:hypothetical protein
MLPWLAAIMNPSGLLIDIAFTWDGQLASACCTWALVVRHADHEDISLPR